MFATHTQMVKWTFPAFALIIGILWYKRRQADRADPGGINKNCHSKENSTDQEIASSDSNSSLHDSGIQNNESCSLSPPNQQVEDIRVEEIVSIPRKTSENLDIPQKRSGSPCISGHSRTPPNDDGEVWYSFVDTSSKMEIQLGSNPIISNFDMVAKSRGASSLEEAADSDDKVLKIFENIVEEEEQKLAPENKSIEVVNQNEENNTNNECNYLPSEEPSVSTPLKDNVKTPARTLSERDSANHSPVSGVLEGSVTDEARSEGSTDSGKGGSIKGHTKDTVMPMIYEFSIPQSLVGRLIGRHGSFLQNIRHKAEVSIVLKRHPISRDQKLCAIEGSTEGINVALEMIRQKFPEKKFPQLTLHQISPLIVPEDIPWFAELRQLSLVEGVNNDVVICHIVKPNRLFVQLPTHPTYPSLRILDERMTQLYNTTESPSAPDELTSGMILVAKWYNTWVRVYVEQPDPHGEQHLVRLVDHGGYWVFSSSEMRKIRSDYLTLPFQAIEIFLANVQPKDGEWNQEAYNTVAQMCTGIVGQAQIEGYINTNTYISLYLNIQKHGVISLADELIARGFAESIPLENIIPEEGILIS
ncbi:KH domain-containing protein akap-1 [Bombus vosnesenskii]|uniref:KH domain-containing protein akap-1 n=1 Tax=Bombus vosnesenskii TaxID=207650 RepID=A0A6J3JXY0_9HYME|nr:KH domain-containing protein akap-1 [Bombus vosnesenskii]XP_033345703.1 KH domain-containing protein akap-1 [Bombus vosnesenskii]XP_033345704.1 KH domain-containing protein akap-1 [Bombus vosnesenskii]XP_033345705.1 KH domain-containing protein akap-1 [Bombus vosnesenskii]XP_033345706.1 KH domain-containing protein akap-1 [Bombus vosnesenskii]